MRTAERPRLEVNAQPLRELAQAIEAGTVVVMVARPCAG